MKQEYRIKDRIYKTSINSKRLEEVEEGQILVSKIE